MGRTGLVRAEIRLVDGPAHQIEVGMIRQVEELAALTESPPAANQPHSGHDSLLSLQERHGVNAAHAAFQQRQRSGPKVGQDQGIQRV